MTREEEKLLLELGKRITKLRKEAGFSSQESFAFEAGIPRTQYARYEKGVNITYLSLRKVLKHHKISPAEFFKDIK